MTSYDELYTEFVNIAHPNDNELKNVEQKYDFIHSGIRLYNFKMDTELTYDDTNEQINEDLDNDSFLILAHCLKYIYLDRQLDYFVQIWQPFNADIGLKNYQSQLKGLQDRVDKEEAILNGLIIKYSDDWEV